MRKRRNEDNRVNVRGVAIWLYVLYDLVIHMKRCYQGRPIIIFMISCSNKKPPVNYGAAFQSQRFILLLN